MSTSDRLTRIFDDMSKERDKPTNTKTTGNIRAVDGGYEQEIVSTSSPRPRYGHGDQVETVTKRVVRSTASPDGRARSESDLRLQQSNPTSRSSSSHAPAANPPPAAPRGSSARSLSSGAARPAASPAVGGVIPPGSGVAGAGSRPLPSPANSLRNDASPGSHWQRAPRAPEPVPNFSAVPPSSAGSERSESTTTTSVYEAGSHRGRNRRPRSLQFGSTTTTNVEPSRLTPMRVERDYAPVKYVSRAELRRLREERALRQSALGPGLRRSSVPRLDSVRYDERMDARSSRSNSRSSAAGGSGRGFAVPSPQPRSMSGANRPFTEEEYRYHTQQRTASDPFAEVPADVEPIGESPAPRAPQQFWGPNGPGSGGRTRSSPAASRRGASPVSSRRAYSASQPRHHAPAVPYADEDDFDRRSVSSAGSRRSVSSSVTAASLRALAPRGPSLQDLARMLCNARGISRPPPDPAYAADAFCLLAAGTYLVKYGRNGQPHERWITLRIMDDDNGRSQPYLVWALHKDSATIKDRVNLVHLFQVSTGATGPNFERHFVGADALRGPHVGSKHSTLPTDFAMRFHFASQTNDRSIDVLALDDQTFRCWVLVMNYLAQVNASGNGAAPADVDSLPPESVRSGSSRR